MSFTSFDSSAPANPDLSHCLPQMEGSGAEITEEVEKAPAEEGGGAPRGYKKVFVAGATGRTGRRVVDQLLAKGFEVRAGAVDVGRARSSLPSNSNVEIVSPNQPAFLL